MTTQRKAEGVAKGIKRVKAKGKPWGGVPHGYRVKKRIVDGDVASERVKDPENSQTVELIWSMTEAGMQAGPIAQESLNARGLRSQPRKPSEDPRESGPASRGIPRPSGRCSATGRISARVAIRR